VFFLSSAVYNGLKAESVSAPFKNDGVEGKIDSALIDAKPELLKAIAERHLTLGVQLEKEQKKVRAFRSYLKAMEYAQILQDEDLLLRSYAALSAFYNFNKVFEKAKAYKLKEIKLLRGRMPIDSAEYENARMDLMEIYFTCMPDSLDERELLWIMNFASRNNQPELKLKAAATIRAHWMEKGRFQDIYEFYVHLYPEALIHLRDSDYALYLRMKAILCEANADIDSAFIYMEQAQIFASAGDNLFMESKFYFRYGQFLERQKQPQNAIPKYQKAIELATKANYLPFAIDAAIRLETIYLNEKDYEMAYQYSSLNKNLNDTFNSVLNKDELLRLEIDNESTLNELALKKQELLNHDRLNKEKNKTRYSAIIGIAIFILAIGLFNRLRYIRKTKKILEVEQNKSESLLLNILPADVALELKSTGKAQAKNHESVTVFFSDFADFTQIAERLSAQELVTEVNEYFEVFDAIVEKHHVEKIKTIGDSYMGAAGLNNKEGQSAKNAVLACLEMQEFISSRFQKKKSQGKSGFQMRVGIHTGPVVAGIVGAIKFQYDLWGDTVNTANRMESHGEIGKVNISEDTYNLIKDNDEFEFHSRDAKEVKGKGIQNMYFVSKKSAKPKASRLKTASNS
jgi:class 3 adenylate cyclase